MSSTARIQVRMDSTLKKEATEIFSQMGLDTSTAITMYFRQVVNTRRLPFTPSAPTAFEKRILDADREGTIRAGSADNMIKIIDNA